MVFALVIGVASPWSTAGRSSPPHWLQAVYEIVLKVIGMAMQLAPIGVAALLFSVTATPYARALNGPSPAASLLMFPHRLLAWRSTSS